MAYCLNGIFSLSGIYGEGNASSLLTGTRAVAGLSEFYVDKAAPRDFSCASCSGPSSTTTILECLR